MTTNRKNGGRLDSYFFFILKCFAKMRVKELGARKETNREWLKEVSKCMSAAIRVSINLRNFTFPEIGKFREISLQKKKARLVCVYTKSTCLLAVYRRQIDVLKSVDWIPRNASIIFARQLEKLGPFLRKKIELTITKTFSQKLFQKCSFLFCTLFFTKLVKIDIKNFKENRTCIVYK